MAKTLKGGKEINSPFGDVWTSAILVCDIITLDFNEQIMNIRADIYKDTAARTAGDRAIMQTHAVDKPTFLANFDTGQAVTTMKTQSEDFILTVEDGEGNLIYGDDFE